jgi:hypothetical protein
VFITPPPQPAQPPPPTFVVLPPNPQPQPQAPIVVRPLPAQKPDGPLFLQNGEKRPDGQLFLQNGQKPDGQLFLQNGQQQKPGGPIIIQLQPQTVNIKGNGGGGNPPHIAAQGLTPPVATVVEDLLSLVFGGEGQNVITRCPKVKPRSWIPKTWTSGGIRPGYYINAGRKGSFDECQKACDDREDCYFCTMTASKQCHFLITTHQHTCRMETLGHFGPIGEQCTPRNPCPSAYKVCGKPDCSLQSLVEVYCRTFSKQTALNTCKNGNSWR